MLIKKT